MYMITRLHPLRFPLIIISDLIERNAGDGIRNYYTHLGESGTCAGALFNRHILVCVHVCIYACILLLCFQCSGICINSCGTHYMFIYMYNIMLSDTRK